MGTRSCIRPPRLRDAEHPHLTAAPPRFRYEKPVQHTLRPRTATEVVLSQGPPSAPAPTAPAPADPVSTLVGTSSAFDEAGEAALLAAAANLGGTPPVDVGGLDKPLATWTEGDTGKWLDWLGLGAVVEEARAQRVTGAVLLGNPQRLVKTLSFFSEPDEKFFLRSLEVSPLFFLHLFLALSGVPGSRPCMLATLLDAAVLLDAPSLPDADVGPGACIGRRFERTAPTRWTPTIATTSTPSSWTSPPPPSSSWRIPAP